MKNLNVRSFIFCFAIATSGAALAYNLRDFDFEGKLGIGIGGLLVIFLVVTYVPLIFLYLKKKRNDRP